MKVIIFFIKRLLWRSAQTHQILCIFHPQSHKRVMEICSVWPRFSSALLCAAQLCCGFFHSFTFFSSVSHQKIFFFVFPFFFVLFCFFSLFWFWRIAFAAILQCDVNRENNVHGCTRVCLILLISDGKWCLTRSKINFLLNASLLSPYNHWDV